MSSEVVLRHTFDEGKIYQGDCLAWLKSLPDDAVDLVFGSPPYEDCRTYGELQFDLKGEDWVAWMKLVVKESLRVCKGLVAYVIEGKTEQYKYTATPLLLMADLHREGVCLRKPPLYYRNGIMGSGGPDWWRNDYEFILCATKNRGRLPWSENTFGGSPPKFAPGGAPSYRSKDGRRINQEDRKKIKALMREKGLSQREAVRQLGIKLGVGVSGVDDSGATVQRCYGAPEITNPGNVIKCRVGGGHLGSNIAHEGEAPFPEALAERFVRSFCPPGGIVCDPFGGSGTTAAVAVQAGRSFLTIDIRKSQVKLIRRRVVQARGRKGFML